MNGNTSELFARPLKKYLSEKNNIIGNFDLWELKFTYEELGWECTGSNYFATWKLENDSLFLIKIDPCRNVSEDLVKSEFGSNRVFAYWVTETIKFGTGELITRPFGFPYYEGEQYLELKEGKVVTTRNINYLIRDNNLLFPGSDFLADTIKLLIINSINETERDSTDVKKSFLGILFWEDGKIDLCSEWERYNDKIVIRKAKEVLKEFPKLMKVTYEIFYPYYVYIIFRREDWE